jgi:hypothetical protein
MQESPLWIERLGARRVLQRDDRKRGLRREDRRAVTPNKALQLPSHNGGHPPPRTFDTVFRSLSAINQYDAATRAMRSLSPSTPPRSQVSANSTDCSTKRKIIPLFPKNFLFPYFSLNKNKHLLRINTAYKYILISRLFIEIKLNFKGNNFCLYSHWCEYCL